jgi:hypothetical protein
MVRESNRVSKAEAIQMAQDVKMGWKEWEKTVRLMLREAETKYGNRPDPTEAQRRSGKRPLAPDAGYWRDKDRKTKEGNQKRIPGHLDWIYWRVYRLPEGLSPYFAMPEPLREALPQWKRLMIASFPVLQEGEDGMSFDLHLECKTGTGKPNPEQLRTIRRVNRNPGAHAFVIYPTHRGWLRGALGL